MNRTFSWQWTREQIIERLSLLNARAAQRGRACPVAALVVARLEAL